MSRLHAHKRYHGQSGSKRPLRTTKPEWAPYDKEFVENKIIELAKQGYSPAMIGLILRDQYGIPDVRLYIGKSLQDFLEEKGLLPDIPWDLIYLLKRAYRVYKHIELNPRDTQAKRNYQLIISKIHRLAKYYKRKGVLPKDWKYSIEIARLYAVQ
ncbi:NEQ487 [Nanoarchaeum equitans Kin4-M]|uniref:Small ribosomal subunit protein uS15 n=1 Tax=Nanoarchaeum equitans (strain Kin4-M) TaxID=228908 RepID=RS15_NANEQ|nr:RecName: Full=Small ribosomal subunit protein uS15; AltName: Full=30S ribosomal protein S15 [Nanoarchaeum equitans Kin4-M]AAR39330.1 NEQ487 [Nanoarchaeum equitans Kin4-M]